MKTSEGAQSFSIVTVTMLGTQKFLPEVRQRRSTLLKYRMLYLYMGIQ
jgi:hypothetical protein